MKITLPVVIAREALEFWLHTYILKDNVKIKDMKFKTDGQCEITFEQYEKENNK